MDTTLLEQSELKNSIYNQLDETLGRLHFNTNQELEVWHKHYLCAALQALGYLGVGQELIVNISSVRYYDQPSWNAYLPMREHVKQNNIYFYETQLSVFNPFYYCIVAGHVPAQQSQNFIAQFSFTEYFLDECIYEAIAHIQRGSPLRPCVFENLRRVLDIHHPWSSFFTASELPQLLSLVNCSESDCKVEVTQQYKWLQVIRDKVQLESEVTSSAASSNPIYKI